MRARSIAIQVLVVVIVVGLLAFAAVRTFSRKAAAQRESAAAAQAVAVPVTTAGVVTANLESVLQVTGNVVPDHKAALASKIPGKVIAVTVAEGDPVARGQVVVRLDDSDIRAQVAQAQAAVQAAEASRGMAQARLDLALAGARPQERKQAEQNVEQAKAAVSAAQQGLQALRKGAREQERRQAEQQVRQAQAALDNANADLRRAQDLFEKGAVSQQQLDLARTQQKVAEAQYQTAKEQLDLVRVGARPEEIKAAEDRVTQAQAALQIAEQQLSMVREGARAEDIRTAREQVSAASAGVAQAQAALQAAQVALDNTVIRSALGGQVAQREVDPGQTVMPSQPLLVVVDNRQVYVKAKVSEDEIRKVRPGQSVRVEVDAYPGEAFHGVVTEILPAAEQETRMFEVRVRVPNSQSRLKAAMFARCQIGVARFAAVAAPRRAVVDVEGRKTVFVVRDGKAHSTPVELGIEQGDLVQVISGVRPGDEVVVTGQNRLRDGDRVTVQRGEA
jgi:RND family efflux transporter MFP subunit